MSAQWEIRPSVGVGPVQFGMTRQQVRAAVGAPWEEFQRTPSSVVADLFKTMGIFAYYTEGGELEALEFSGLQDVRVESLKLATTPTAQLVRDVLLFDPDAEIEADGFTSRRLGAGIWTEGDIDQPPQSVIAFAQGYYD